MSILERLQALLPPAWRWILGGDAMLSERDLRKIRERNNRWRMD